MLVSSDKAVNPTNVMGATKRLAEIVCRSLQGRGTQFVLVRFGNVFGSAGSVIPRFREQIGRGGPVTVTHPDITRYFMSLSEATQLLLQAALQGKGGEILVLDMGEPVRIIDLAHDMIRLSGRRSRIAFRSCSPGLRPGEKLFEELLTAEEATLPTPHPKLRIALSRAANFDAVGQMVAWCERDRPADDAEVRARLKTWIPEYVPPAGAPVQPIPRRRPTPWRRRRCRCARRAELGARGAKPHARPARSAEGVLALRSSSALAAVEIRIERRVVVHLELAIDAPERAPFGRAREQRVEAAREIGALQRRGGRAFRGTTRPMGVRRVGARCLGAHVEDLEREDRQPIDRESTIEPADSELCHASARATAASRSSNASSIFSIASLRRWL